ncbi:MAG: cation:proton antiporter [Proteobacteria bacterium]|nr:cation:proton antiporter [Pseudomonadota bacterium]MBU1648924.1 cation:proton antiporter [Pseudomonadota bacterium]
MEVSSQFLLTIGGILLLGLLTSTLARRTFLPRVTLLLIFGIVIGKEALDIIPQVFSDHFEIIADMTLVMVGFLLGGKLTKASVRESAGKVFWISLCATVVATVIVSFVLIWIGVSQDIAILLGCIASTTAPAAVLDVATEVNIKGDFTNLLLSIVALDDVWSLVLFAVGMAVATSFNGLGGDMSFLLMASKEIGGAVLLGVLIGLPAAYLTGRVKKGQPILTEALGMVFVCGGLAIWLGVSFLIASMVMGTVIANVARHHDYPFHAIKGIEWPFMVIFFVLAGASLELSILKDIGVIGATYILCRATGKYLGAKLGSQISRADQETKSWMGLALLPQAGVAIGMALVASNQFPEYRQMLLSIVISSTMIFEIIGPVFTRLAIRRAQGSPCGKQ